MYLSDREPPLVNTVAAKHAHTALVGKKVPAAVYFLGMTSLLTDISSEMVVSILPIYLMTVLSLSPMQFGIVDGVFNGSTALVRLLAAWIADHKNKHKAVAFLGYVLSALSRIAMLFAGFSGAVSVAGVLLLDRIGKGIRTAPRDALIAAHAVPGHIAQAFGVHRAMDAVGAVIGPVLATVILVWMPQRFDVVFLTSFCFAVLGLLVLGLCVNPAQPLTQSKAAVNLSHSAPTDTQQAMSLDLCIKAFRNPHFVWLLIVSTVLAVFTLSDNMLYLGLHKRGSLPMQYIALCFAATGLLFMLLAVPMGKCADKFGSVWVFLMGYVSLVLLYIFLAFIPSTGYLDIVFCISLLGIYYACTDGVLMAIAARQLPINVRATGLACLATVISLGRLVSSIAFGWVWQTTTQSQAIVIFGVLMLVALSCVLWTVLKLNKLNVAMF